MTRMQQNETSYSANELFSLLGVLLPCANRAKEYSKEKRRKKKEKGHDVSDFRDVRDARNVESGRRRIPGA